MSTQPLTSPIEDAETSAAVRSRAYRVLAEAIDYPDDEMLDEIREGLLADALDDLLALLDPEGREQLDPAALRAAGDDDELQVEYTRLFDVGVSGPPCPLYGGLYGEARMKNMEEAVRFYNHFGLTLSEEPRELPDHLRTQLEFLHYLAYREAEALQKGGDAGPYRRAQRDFIDRHPGRWLPKLLARLAKQDPAPMPFFSELMRTVERLLRVARAELEGS